MEPDQIADRFRRLYAADAAAGRVRTLSAYRRMFAGFESVVEREFAALAGTAAAPGAGRGAADGGLGDGPRSVSPTAELLARLAGGGRRRYSGLGEIARGGMGTVLRVRDDVLSTAAESAETASPRRRPLRCAPTPRSRRGRGRWRFSCCSPTRSRGGRSSRRRPGSDPGRGAQASQAMTRRSAPAGRGRRCATLGAMHAP